MLRVLKEKKYKMSLLKKRDKKNYKTIFKNILSFKFLRRTSIYYFLRLTRLEASIYSISAGFACGSMVSFTPFMGFHFVLAILVAFVIRGNLIASMIGTAVGNPFTFPFIWLTIHRIGIPFTNNYEVDKNIELNIENMLSGGLEVLKPMLIGSAIICIPVWVVSYFIIRTLLTGFKRKKT